MTKNDYADVATDASARFGVASALDAGYTNNGRAIFSLNVGTTAELTT